MISKTQTLRGFYDSHFVPDRMAKASVNTRRAHVVPLNRFRRFLGREPMPTDLSIEALERFVGWLDGKGYSEDARRRSRRMLCAVWAMAHTRGIVHTKPPDPPRRDGSRVGQLMDFVKRYQMERDLSVSSRRQHEYVLRCFGRFLGRAPALEDLNAATVNGWLTAMCDAEHPSRSTIKNYRRNLLVLWRAAHDIDLVPELPNPRRIKKIKVVRPLPRCWSETEIKRLLAAATNVPGRFPHNGIRRGAFWRAFVLCGYCLGLRFGDLLRLRTDDVGEDGRIVLLQQKTGQAVTCYLDEPAIEAVKLLASGREFIFRGILNHRTVQETFRGLVRRTGLVGTIRTLRKTGATMCECATPGSASAFLGHRSPELAARYYVDPRWVQQTKPRAPTIGFSGQEGGEA